jgi:uncharacterized protein DUF3352
VIERLKDRWEELRWGVRRALDRLPRRDGPPLDRGRVMRRRRAVALVVMALALYAVIRYAAIPALPCQVSPTESCPPTDHAIALVPAGAAAYLHIELDRGSDQFKAAEEVASRLPHSAEIAQGIFGVLGLAPGLDLRRDVGTWVGDELAFASIGGDRPLALISVKDEEGAQRYLARVGRGKPHPLRGRNAGLRAYSNGLAFAELHGFLALGAAPAVRAVVETGQERGKSLSDSEPADAARDELPDKRLADLYLSPRGVARFLAGRGGLASQLDTFADFGASRGIAAALVAHDDGLELQLDSALDAERVKASPSFFQAFPSFDPSLAGEFSPDTLVYLNIDDPADAVQALLRQAEAAAPGVVGAFDRFERQIRGSGVDLESQVFPVLGGEAAVGAASGRAAPYLTLAFKDVDEDRAREEMAQLQAPLVAALNPARTGQAPSFGAKRLDDTVMHSVRLSPALNLAYAIFDGKLVVSTNPAGVRQAVEGDEDLGGSDAFRAATNDASSGVSALVFLNLDGLVRRAGPLGLDQIVGGFGADVAKLNGLGLTVKSDDDNLETTLFLGVD